MSIKHDTKTYEITDQIDLVKIDNVDGATGIEVIKATNEKVQVTEQISYTTQEPCTSHETVDQTLTLSYTCCPKQDNDCDNDCGVTYQIPEHPWFNIIQINSTSGEITGNNLASEKVAAQIQNGSIKLGFARPPTDVNVQGQRGSITVILPLDDNGYKVDATTEHGSINVTVKKNPKSQYHITAHTVNGSVTVLNPEPPRVR